MLFYLLSSPFILKERVVEGLNPRKSVQSPFIDIVCSQNCIRQIIRHHRGLVGLKYEMAVTFCMFHIDKGI